MFTKFLIVLTCLTWRVDWTCDKWPTNKVCAIPYHEIMYHSFAITYHSGDDLDPLLVAGIIWHESKLDAQAEGPSGRDIGLMQVVYKYTKGKAWTLMTGLEKYSKEDLKNPWTNVKAGTAFLKWLKKNPAFKKDYVAHYACGNVLSWDCLKFQGYCKSFSETWKQTWKFKVLKMLNMDLAWR